MKDIYRPEILHLGRAEDKARIESLLANSTVQIFDTIYQQLEELMKIRFSNLNFSEEEMANAIHTHLENRKLDEYGLWIYYPWSNRLVHTLLEEDFIAVRTNRNQLKITVEEQNILKAKTVGIIGLSVGQSIALTMAMERICGTIKLADFDEAELSNLNRIRTGIHNLSINKTIIAAREIAEIDPFINVVIYSQGLNENNMKDFMLDGKLDILVEVCDGLDIKIKSRIQAKQYGIPVLMETNDKCLFDIERFDLDAEYPIFHGLINQQDIDSLANLTAESRLSLIKKIVNADNLSSRMKDSFVEIGKSIRSWPQLASSVVLGGAVTTDVARKILLGEEVMSGRCYFDIDAVLKGYSILNN